jgi:pimeloyl-ACP methyl ester carboxylesterase
LAKFIIDFKKKNPATKIRLMGHSLGTEVIMHALLILPKKPKAIESVYFFGSSIPANQLSENIVKMHKTVRGKIINYYSKNDDVLRYADRHGLIENPIGFFGIHGRAVSKCVQRHVIPKNHRFASYADVLKSFP